MKATLRAADLKDGQNASKHFARRSIDSASPLPSQIEIFVSVFVSYFHKCLDRSQKLIKQEFSSGCFNLMFSASIMSKCLLP